jgi:hypothetical protein
MVRGARGPKEQRRLVGPNGHRQPAELGISGRASFPAQLRKRPTLAGVRCY